MGSIGQNMYWGYNNNNKQQGTTFTATCNSNYFFLSGSSGSYTLTTSTSKVATCSKSGNDEYWMFSDGIKDDVGDCAGENWINQVYFT